MINFEEGQKLIIEFEDAQRRIIADWHDKKMQQIRFKGAKIMHLEELKNKLIEKRDNLRKGGKNDK